MTGMWASTAENSPSGIDPSEGCRGLEIAFVDAEAANSRIDNNSLVVILVKSCKRIQSSWARKRRTVSIALSLVQRHFQEVVNWQQTVEQGPPGLER